MCVIEDGEVCFFGVDMFVFVNFCVILVMNEDVDIVVVEGCLCKDFLFCINCVVCVLLILCEWCDDIMFLVMYFM